MQIAFSGAIRVGDVVQLENGQWWGRIEEITLSYVVVRLWDERRLVLPCTYFTTEPFENWTRSATEIMGAVEFDVDFSVPFAEMRAELDRLLAENELWDGRRGVLQVTDAVGGMVRVRIVVSAPNAGALFDLRCAVREGMVNWVQHWGVLPTQRIEAAETVTEVEPRRTDGDGETRRVAVQSVLRQPRGRRTGAGVRRHRQPRGRLRQSQRPPLIFPTGGTCGEYVSTMRTVRSFCRVCTSVCGILVDVDGETSSRCTATAIIRSRRAIRVRRVARCRRSTITRTVSSTR